MENEDYVTHKPQMRGNEEENMEDPKVKMILTPKIQMKDKSLDDNYKSKELVVHIEVDYEVQN
jgi:hypothetical protein